MRHARSTVLALVAGLSIGAVSGLSLLGSTGAASNATAGDPAPEPAVEVAGAVELRPVPIPVVRISGRGCDGRSLGSGVLLPDGRVLTASHVVEGDTSASVDLPDGSSVRATVAATAIGGRDVAVLTVPGNAVEGAALEGAAIADSPAVKGDAVRVLGHPMGGTLAERTGRVAGSLDTGPLALDGGRVLTLDFPVVDGMSGGPVVDATGAIVGVAIGVERNTATGIAVPIDEVRALLDAGVAPTVPAVCPGRR